MLHPIFSVIISHFIIIKLVGDDEDFIINTPGIDSHMLLKCNSTLDHNGSCWKLSLTHISNKDAYCNASNNSFGIISIFPPSLYSDIESEKGVPILLRALEFGYNFDESENSCVKVTGSVPQDLDFFPSVTPGEIRYIVAIIIVAIIVYMGVLDWKGQI